MEKPYSQWNKIKSSLNARTSLPVVQKREIWWASIGLNIGDEENGKGSTFSRPVLIFKKFNQNIFWGLPLTTQTKKKPYYYPIHFHGKDQCIMLSQLRLWDTKRLSNKLGRISKAQFEDIKEALIDII